MSTQSYINVTASGSNGVATYTQTQNSNTVYVQQVSLVDPTGTGTNAIGATITANGLQVIPTFGTTATSGLVTASSIAAGGNSTLSSSVMVTSGKTGTLQHGVFASTQPTQWQVNSVNNVGGATTIFTFLTNAYEAYDFKPGMWNEATTVASTGAAYFQVIATNLSNNANQTANAYATFFWAEN
jgi:hypothetical protein